MSRLWLWGRGGLLGLTVCLAACSTTSPFVNKGPENLRIVTDVRSGSASVDVYAAGDPCHPDYLGTVNLEGNSTTAGLPVGKRILMEVVFQGGNYFTGYHSSSYPIYFTPRAGLHYEARVSNIDDMYGAELMVVSARGVRHKVPSYEPHCPAK